MGEEFHTIRVHSHGKQIFYQDAAPASDIQHTLSREWREDVLPGYDCALACQYCCSIPGGYASEN